MSSRDPSPKTHMSAARLLARLPCRIPGPGAVERSGATRSASMLELAIPIHLLVGALFSALAAFHGQWFLAALFLLLVAAVLPLRVSFIERRPLLVARILLHVFAALVAAAALIAGPAARLDVLLLAAMAGFLLVCPAIPLARAGLSALFPASLLAFLHVWGYGHFPSPGAPPGFLAAAAVLSVLATAVLVLVPLAGLVRAMRGELVSSLLELEESRASSMAKSRFLAMVGHELRTPLNGLMGALDLVAVEPLTRGQREHLDLARSDVAVLRNLVDDAMEFSRLEEGGVVLERRSALVQSEMPRMLHPCRLMARAKGVAFREAVSEDLPRVMLDVDRFRQILLHVVGNAVKYTGSGFVEVALSEGSPREDGRVELVLAVRDTGIGMTEEMRCALLEASLRPQGEHPTGLNQGFALVKRLVEAMDGHVDIESRTELGTVVRLHMNCERSLPAPPRERSTPLGGRQRILLVEDDAVSRLVAARLLRQDGYEVEVACNGEEALHAWSRGTFDAILMDCEMPVMDGYEATRRIRLYEQREGRPRSLIVAYTAGVLGTDRARCQECGMDLFLAKPISRRELRDLLGRACEPLKTS